MDDIVKQAMRKWPNTPHCYGWLGLDARGEWYMRDESIQAMGSFKAACDLGDRVAKGERLSNERLLGFIARNYLCESDSSGVEHWFFQNGPQRVYVELAATPYILRLSEDYLLMTHTGLSVIYESCHIDEIGRVYVTSNHGVSLVHTQDVYLVERALDSGAWQLTV